MLVCSVQIISYLDSQSKVQVFVNTIFRPQYWCTAEVHQHGGSMLSLLRSRFFGMSRNAPPKETASHIRTTFLSIVWPITAFVPFSRT